MGNLSRKSYEERFNVKCRKCGRIMSSDNRWIISRACGGKEYSLDFCIPCAEDLLGEDVFIIFIKHFGEET